MSVINRVLRDLDRQGRDDTPLSPGIHPIETGAETPRLSWLRLGLLLSPLLLATVAGWYWTRPAPAPAPAPATPAPTTPAPTATAPADEPPGEPQLRLSTELSLAEPAPATLPPPPPVPAMRVSAAPPPTPAIRLDTRLEAKAPPPSPPAVVKAPRPPSAAEQADSLWRQANEWLDQGRDSQAQTLLEQALGQDPAHPRARQRLVVLALDQGRRDAAEALLREGARLHPGSVWFTRSLAQLHIQKAEYAQAAQVLKAGLNTTLTPQAEAGDWALYASTLARLGRGEDTAAAYREALRRDASQGAWWIGLGLALEQSGHPEEARDAFGRALQTRLSAELRDFAARKLQ